TEEALAERNDRDKIILQEMDDDEVKRILDDPYAYTKPTSKRSINYEEAEPAEEEPRPQISENEPIRERRRSRYADLDESRHRHFENFGGIDEEDPDVIKLSLALARHEESNNNESESSEEKAEPGFNNKEAESLPEIDDSLYEEAPTKTMVMQGFRPSRSNGNTNRNDNNRRSNFHRKSASDNRNENRNNSSSPNRNRNNRMNRNGNNSNSNYREQKRYFPQRNNNGFRRRPSRRDDRE
ncbi:MAG: hypothetical protein J6Z11_13940, partial [Candidatus Riflebacteria bacterium]|nr:hypothetical protein [Candidatus Riflebacteria bacterium]